MDPADCRAWVGPIRGVFAIWRRSRAASEWARHPIWWGSPSPPSEELADQSEARLDEFSVRGGYLGNRVIAVAESGLDG